MLTHPTLDQFHELGLKGMARAFADLSADPATAELSHGEWPALLLEQEAAIEDVDFRTPRGLERALMLSLAGGRRIEEADNPIIEGPTGVGKSWLACALGHRACRDNCSVLYQRAPGMVAYLALGSSPWGRSSATTCWKSPRIATAAAATLIASQLPLERWHDVIGDPTIADAILDRFVHNAHRIHLHGESMRRKQHLEITAGWTQPGNVNRAHRPCRRADTPADFIGIRSPQ